MDKFSAFFIFGIIVQNVLLSRAFSSEGINEGVDTIETRLSNTTVPTKYNINLKTFLHEQQTPQSYIGEVDIFFYVQETKNEFGLHAKEFQNMTIKLFDTNNEPLNITYGFLGKKNFIILNTLNYYLATGQEYRLSFKFINNYENGQVDRGFFYNGEMALTHFQPSYARLAFPCFDEPGFKSTFNISIDHGDNFTAISNMPLEKTLSIESSNGTMVRSVFQKSPPMSTYLVAFVIFNKYSNYTLIVNDLAHRIFFPTTPSNKFDTKEKLDIIVKSAECVEVLENLLSVKCPLQKLDHIPTPKKILGMENWGLVLYNSNHFNGHNSALYFDTLIVIAHEISHQWFGNLVTPKWWSSIWISEGMATYFSSVVLKQLIPITEKIFNYKTDLVAFNENKITTNFKTSTEIESFANIETIYKSAGIIKMFHHAIGIEVFMSGIKKFLHDNAYKSFDDNDLFRSIDTFNKNYDAYFDYDDDHDYYGVDKPEQIQNIPSSTIMMTWLKNEGVPHVQIERNYGMDTITIYQRPYQRIENKSIMTAPEFFERLWWIPINFASSKNREFYKTTADIIMPPKAEVTYNLKDIGLSSLTDDDWLIIDKQNTGLYVIEYDKRNYDLITSDLIKLKEEDFHIIPSKNRAVLLRDLLLNMNNNMGKSLHNILHLIKYIKTEKDVEVLNQFSKLVMSLIQRLGFQEKTISELKSYIRCYYATMGQMLFNKIITHENMTGFEADSLFDLGYSLGLKSYINYTESIVPNYLLSRAESNYATSYKPNDIPRLMNLICYGSKNLTQIHFIEILPLFKTFNHKNSDIMEVIFCAENQNNIDLFIKYLMEVNELHADRKLDFLAALFKRNFNSREPIINYMLKTYKIFFNIKTPSEIESYMAELVPFVTPELKQKVIFFVSSRYSI